MTNIARSFSPKEKSIYWRQENHQNHGLINRIDKKAKCRHIKILPVKGICGRWLSEVIDWRYSQLRWYFCPSFLNCFLSNLLSGSLSPPLPTHPVWKSILYSRIQCVRGERYGVLRQINTCRKVPLQVSFFKWRLFCIAFYSISLIFPRSGHPSL
jgi:hypothetical protein